MSICPACLVRCPCLSNAWDRSSREFCAIWNASPIETLLSPAFFSWATNWGPAPTRSPSCWVNPCAALAYTPAGVGPNCPGPNRPSSPVVSIAPIPVADALCRAGDNASPVVAVIALASGCHAPVKPAWPIPACIPETRLIDAVGMEATSLEPRNADSARPATAGPPSIPRPTPAPSSPPARPKPPASRRLASTPEDAAMSASSPALMAVRPRPGILPARPPSPIRPRPARPTTGRPIRQPASPAITAPIRSPMWC